MTNTESIGLEFMKKTRHSQLPDTSPQQQGVPMPPAELAVPETARRIPLPKPADLQIPATDLRTAIENRRSVRNYSNQPLTLEELSFLLWCTQGVRSVTKHPITFRTVPSAGARHAFETYLLVNRVGDLPSGLYRFMAMEHMLAEHQVNPHLTEEITRACYDQKIVLNSAVTFIWVAVPERMTWRYLERGYRYLHLDAGHVCQNLYLAAEAIHCGVCAIAAYDDDDLNAVLGINGEDLFAIYVAALGKKGD